MRAQQRLAAGGRRQFRAAGSPDPDYVEEAFHPKVTVLQENTEHHIEEEEGELFPKVRKIRDSAKGQEGGRKMEEMKERLTRGQRAA